MGEASGRCGKRQNGGLGPGWHRSDPDASDKLKRFLEGGRETRFKRKYPTPSPGDRFGELTVIVPANNKKEHGAEVVCSCGYGPYFVTISNLRGGKSTRCRKCGRDKTHEAYIKKYKKYRDILPDDEHRRRLVNRVSAARGRCHNEKNTGFANYGGRGITVCSAWRGPEGNQNFLRYIITVEGWDVPEFDMDRIDTDDGYRPGNIRFCSRRENMLNKRSVQEMQCRIDRLEDRLRHCTCGAEKPVHSENEQRSLNRPQ